MALDAIYVPMIGSVDLAEPEEVQDPELQHPQWQMCRERYSRPPVSATNQ